MISKNKKKILVIGGGGYVGTLLVEKLVKLNHFVRVFDLFIYGNNIDSSKNIEIIKGDIRFKKDISKIFYDIDIVFHLACISNDPSFELNPELSKSINYDSFKPIIKLAKESGVKRFVYASSSSVYGLRNEIEINEELELKPLTDYSKYKAMCEEILIKESSNVFNVLIARPATVCGYSKRLRLDLTVNILAINAIKNKNIRVFGGQQKRPNIHIDDICNFYINCIDANSEKFNNKIYNVGFENFKIIEIANMIKKTLNLDIPIIVTKTDDIRSYHISSSKVNNVFGFYTKKKISDAVIEIQNAYNNNLILDPFNNSSYYNIKKMQELELV